ncbi:MAG: RloB family protein [Rhodobacteraceae bacterium]|nr:RloB family protein [Paracoccaceae bacterium]
MTIARKALESAKSKRQNLFEKRDRVWAVFDQDEHEGYKDAVNLCESKGVGVARSNPCFEVWLILHEQDYDRPDDRHQVQEILRRLRPEYDKSGAKVPDCGDMVDRVHRAEKRGQALLCRREAEMNPHGRPSTTVGNLTKAIREADETTYLGFTAESDGNPS